MEVSYTTDDLIQQYNCGDLNAIMFDKDSVQVFNEVVIVILKP